MSCSLPSTPGFTPPPSHIRADLHRAVHFQSSPLFAHSIRQSSDDDDQDDDQRRDQGASEEEESEEEGIVLAITAHRGKVGACYYHHEERKMYFVNDSPDGPDSNWDYVDLLIQQVKPTLTLTSSSADASFLDSLASFLSSLGPSSSSSSASSSFRTSVPTEHDGVQLEYRPQRDFLSAAGKAALASLDIVEGGIYAPQEDEAMQVDDDPDGDRHATRRALRVESFVVALEGGSISLGCAGALISYLSRVLLSASHTGRAQSDGRLEIVGLELMVLEDFMLINQDALDSLQIFNLEAHASIHSDAKKEGLSLFGVLNLARTPLGKALMRRWFLRPSLSLAVIEQRHSAVECFLIPDNQAAIEAMQRNFKRIKNIPKLIKSIELDKAKWGDWRALLEFIYGIIMIRDSSAVLLGARDVEILRKLAASFDMGDIRELGKTISDLIDWDESATQNKTSVRPGVNQKLDELRRSYNALPSVLSNISLVISAETPTGFADSISVVYLPQLGYLIAVDRNDQTLSEDGRHQEPEGWEYQFMTEVAVYYKDDKCRDLDEHFGDLRTFAADNEIEILDALAASVLNYAPQLLEACQVVSELDCLLAFAVAARTYEWSRPTMSDSLETSFEEGRHPLVELCSDGFVKNDFCITAGKGIDWDFDLSLNLPKTEEALKEDEASSIVIITGANYSGKSVLLKLVALITYMAHIGSFVPAKNASIGLTDRILTRISARETVSKGSSAFMMDLQQVSFALRNATSRSLVLLDEFGKGTAPEDGAGLFCGVLEHLARWGEHTPRTIAATHFTNVLASELLSPLLPIEYRHMEILIDEKHSEAKATSSVSSSSATLIPAQVTYLYRLRPGLSTKSHAAACASQFGIDDETVSRATHVTNLVLRFNTDELMNMALSDAERLELQDCEAVARRFVALDLSEETCGELELKKVLALIQSALDAVEDDELDDKEKQRFDEIP